MQDIAGRVERFNLKYKRTIVSNSLFIAFQNPAIERKTKSKLQ
jgi:hypothetical protein